MNIEARFMAKVRRSDSGCWLWTGAVIKAGGYGRFGMPCNQVDYAHRASWRIFRGAIPSGHYVCHRCDVRTCVNPDHLFVGTATDNMRDASQKGRIRIPRASFASDETHQVAKLTNDQVRAIRSIPWAKADAARLAREFGVCTRTIWSAHTGRTFKDIQCQQ